MLKREDRLGEVVVRLNGTSASPLCCLEHENGVELHYPYAPEVQSHRLSQITSLGDGNDLSPPFDPESSNSSAPRWRGLFRPFVNVINTVTNRISSDRLSI